MFIFMYIILQFKKFYKISLFCYILKYYRWNDRLSGICFKRLEDGVAGGGKTMYASGWGSGWRGVRNKWRNKIRKMLTLLRLYDGCMEVHNTYLKITIIKELLKGRHNCCCTCACMWAAERTKRHLTDLGKPLQKGRKLMGELQQQLQVAPYLSPTGSNDKLRAKGL